MRSLEVCGVLASVMLLPMAAAAQGVAIGAGVTQIVQGGEGIARGCSLRGYSTGVGPDLTIPFSAHAALAVTVRTYTKGTESGCVGEPAPIRNGTFTHDGIFRLQAAAFSTADARFEARPLRLLRTSLGAGMAWHEGPNVPYVVLGGGVPLQHRRFTFAFGAEYYVMRTTVDHTRITNENFRPITVESLGRSHGWSNAFALVASGTLSLF